MNETKWERLLAITFVIALHAGLGTWLLHYNSAALAISSKEDELLMQIVFLPPRSIPAPVPPRTQRPSHIPRTTRTLSHASTLAMPTIHRGDQPPSADRPLRPLQLALPDALTAVTIERRDPLAHTRPPIEYVATRFDGQWASSGDMFEQAASRHIAVAIALSLFGGGKHICTEDDKRRRMRGCSPAIDAGLER